MSARPNCLNRIIRSILAVLFAVAGSHSLAEFGVIVESGEGGANQTTPYIIQSIVEDIDPFGYSWQQFNVDSSIRYILNPGGYPNGDGEPSFVRLSGSGEVLVVWSRNSPTGFDIVASRFNGAGWTPPEVVAASADDELDPRVTVDPTTSAAQLVYWTDSSTPAVQYREWTASGGWTDAILVSGSGEAACRPDVIVHDGTVHVAYEVHDYGYEQTPRQIVLAKKTGPQFLPEVMSITQRDGRVRPQIHKHFGRLWVDWIDSDQEMAWIGQEADGSGWKPVQYQPYSDFEDLEYWVQGAIRMQAIAP